MTAQEMSALADRKDSNALEHYERSDKDIRRAAERGEHCTFFNFVGGEHLTYTQAQDHYRELGFRFEERTHDLSDGMQMLAKYGKCQDICWRGN